VPAADLCSSVVVLEVRLAFLSGFCAQEAANAAAIAATIKRFVLMTKFSFGLGKKYQLHRLRRKKRAGRKAATQEWLHPLHRR